jgi:hypothetical protein
MRASLKSGSRLSKTPNLRPHRLAAVPLLAPDRGPPLGCREVASGPHYLHQPTLIALTKTSQWGTKHEWRHTRRRLRIFPIPEGGVELISELERNLSVRIKPTYNLVHDLILDSKIAVG